MVFTGWVDVFQIISMLEEEDPSGVFSTFHVRRWGTRGAGHTATFGF